MTQRCSGIGLLALEAHAWQRHRFYVNPTDYRPVSFPPPGPYWCSGYTSDPNDESLSADYAVIVAFPPKGTDITDWWPEACGVETQEVLGITFTDRFPRPSWWTDPAA